MAPHRDISVLQVCGRLQDSWVTLTAPETPHKHFSPEQFFHSGLLYAGPQ